MVIEFALIFVQIAAGVFYGLAETLVWHYEAFKREHPGANKWYWNPVYSWTNKYKNGNKEEGARFPGSTTWLVWLTDGYHLFRTLERVCWVMLLVLSILAAKPEPLYLGWTVARTFVGFWIGFWATYKKKYEI